MLQMVKKRGAEGVFHPEDLLILTAAFDEAWRRLEKSGVRFDSDHQRRQTRNMLGKYIIDAAKDGERDKRSLGDCALLLYGQSSLGNAPRKASGP